MLLSKCRSRCLSRFPHHCVGSARTGNVVGQACESVSYNSLFTAMELSAVGCSCATSFVRFPLKGCGNLVRPVFFHILWRAMQCFSCGCHACESVSCDSPFAAQELRALETWSVRPAIESGCTVTVCGSHVKRVVKLVVEPLATVVLGLCSQLFIMSLTTLPSLRWSWCVDTVVGQACQRVGCAVTDCGSGWVSALSYSSCLSRLSLRCVGVCALTLWSVRSAKESVAQ